MRICKKHSLKKQIMMNPMHAYFIRIAAATWSFCWTAIFDNIGCGSEGQNQINLFCSSLTLHYLLII